MARPVPEVLIALLLVDDLVRVPLGSAAIGPVANGLCFEVISLVGVASLVAD